MIDPDCLTGFKQGQSVHFFVEKFSYMQPGKYSPEHTRRKIKPHQYGIEQILANSTINSLNRELSHARN